MDSLFKCISGALALVSIYLLTLQLMHPDATPMQVFLCGIFNHCAVAQEWTK
jgi:hypothetical protein